MEKNDKIFIGEHEGMIGAAILRRLREEGFTNLTVRTSSELDLTDQSMVADFFMGEHPDYVFLTGTKIGGILASSRYPAEFMYSNVQSAANVIHSCWKSGVKKLLFLGSSCMYPKDCPQPMKEEYLLSGKLEPTSESYAMAKITGVKMCQAYNHQFGTNYIAVVPADLYGPEDDFDLETSHVLPALIRKMHEAKIRGVREMVVWGSGSPRREPFYVDDLADACLFLMDNYNGTGMINVGAGQDVSIRELAQLIGDIVGFRGKIVFDKSKPDGTLQKLLDSSRVRKLGWTPSFSLEDGIRRTYQWYQSQIKGN